jgi:bifunctional ADP-heptose synthase (sugar kinase/adenylyltransferase)
MTVIELPRVQGRLLIFGDTIVDETWYVDVKKLSPEAPIPVASLVCSEPVRSPGGASLAAAYARRRNYPAVYLTSVNPTIVDWLMQKGIDTHSLKNDGYISRVRYIDRASNYHLLRVDNDATVRNEPTSVYEVEALLTCIPDDILGIVILDYQKGIVMDSAVCRFILAYAKTLNIPTYVDTRGDTSKFLGYDFLKLNDKEYVAACAALNVNSPMDLGDKLYVQNLIITKGKQGAEIWNIRSGTYSDHVPDLKKHEGTPDVTGCGDVFDINFCYHHFIEGLIPTESLRLSVEDATSFAYEPIGERLC